MIPQVPQNKCSTAPVPKETSESEPLSSVNRSCGRIRCRKPVLAQIEPVAVEQFRRFRDLADKAHRAAMAAASYFHRLP